LRAFRLERALSGLARSTFIQAPAQIEGSVGAIARADGIIVDANQAWVELFGAD
jgi:hypothetical protein